MKKEKIRIRHTYMLWFQGEADANLETTAEEYKAGLQELFAYMKEQGTEACFLIELGPDLQDPEKNGEIMRAQTEICEESEDFVLVSELPAELAQTPRMKEEVTLRRQD